MAASPSSDVDRSMAMRLALERGLGAGYVRPSPPGQDGRRVASRSGKGDQVSTDGMTPNVLIIGAGTGGHGPRSWP